MIDVLPVLKDYVYGMLAFLLLAYKWILFAYLIASWFVSQRSAGWFVFLSELVDPPLARLRRLTQNKMVIEHFDLTPILLFILIQLAGWLLYNLFKT